MIVVIVIIGIGASIAVPNFARMIQRNEWRGIVQSAQNAENALMALTGLQYAMGGELENAGNPQLLSNWNDLVSNGGKQFIAVYDPSITVGEISVFRVTVANVASGDSEGQKEFYKRTMNNLWPLSWHPDGPVCAVYCNKTGLTTPFVRYDFVYSEYNMSDGGRNFAIFHGVTVGSDGSPDGTDPNRWNIYTVSEEGYMLYGSL